MWHTWKSALTAHTQQPVPGRGVSALRPDGEQSTGPPDTTPRWPRPDFCRPVGLSGLELSLNRVWLLLSMWHLRDPVSPLSPYRFPVNTPLSGLSKWLSDKEFSCEPEDAGDAAGLIPGSGRSPEGRRWQPTPVSLPGESHEQRSLTGYSPWGHKESDTTEATEHTRVHPCLYLLPCLKRTPVAQLSGILDVPVGCLWEWLAGPGRHRAAFPKSRHWSPLTVLHPCHPRPQAGSSFPL